MHTVATSDTALGPVLVDDDGMTLYVFMPDQQGDPTCYDGCAQNWPPLTGEVTAGKGVDASMLGTATRTDGSSQATYNGWPLYRFAADKQPGDTNGQGVKGVWYVVDPSGEPVMPQALGTRTTDLGTFLVAPDGMTLYAFMPDQQGDPTCYDACAQNWPPLTGEVTAGDGVDASLLGTVARKAGMYQESEIQVTYNGWPLYHFAADKQPGDTNGQGVKGVWYVVDPSGEPIR